MSSYTKPAVLVFQELTPTATELVDPLRPVIIGPNAQLHRFSNSTEKALIALGAYDRLNNQSYGWPDRQAGSIVDQASVRLFVEDALLLYFEDLIGVTSNGRGTNTVHETYSNRLVSSTISFKSNGVGNPRASLLKDRDVQVGDIVYVRGVTDEEDTCNEYELWTTVEGFAADTADATIGNVTYGSGNAATTGSNVDLSFTSGPQNCMYAQLHNTSAYSGLASGYNSETYTVTVVKSGISGCAAARLRVVSASGTDNVEELDPGDIGDPVAIGTRGLKIVFAVSEGGSCASDAAALNVAADQLVVGQTWTIEVTGAYEAACAASGGQYTGDFSDTYIVEVTKGGLWAASPEITVTTAKGLDSAGPLAITDYDSDFPVGNHGVTISFIDCGDLPEGATAPVTNASGMGNGVLAGLRKGDKFYITVTGGEAGPVRTLILRDDIPAAIRAATDLDVRLFIKKTIEVTENRISAPPLKNYTLEDTQINVKAGITAYDQTWTSSGALLPLPVYSTTTVSGEVLGTLYAEYREWLAGDGQLRFIGSVNDLDQIPGQLHELNPLKNGAYRALQNSNGTRVGHITVPNPDDIDSWVETIGKLSGKDAAYNLIPMSDNREVQNLVVTHINTESAPESANESAAVFSIPAHLTKMIVGKSGADAQALHPTSTNGDVVLATLEDNPAASGTQYTKLSVPANNAGFTTYGVRSGDIVRFLFTIDAFGAAAYEEFVVDRVLSESSLILLNGYNAAISVPQKVEIWRNLSKPEIVDDLVEQAQSFANRRVVTVWPDIVGIGGNSESGIYLAAAIGGLMGGVVPHQGLTNVEIQGFDDLASRTTDFFTASQLDALSAGGVWVCTESNTGTPYTRHAVTTDVSSLTTREEMNRRNLDSIAKILRGTLNPYIGRTNVTPSMLSAMRYDLMQKIKYLKRVNYSNLLGPQLIDAVIRKDETGAEIFRQHPLSADSVEIVLDLTVPFAANKIELHLVV